MVIFMWLKGNIFVYICCFINVCLISVRDFKEGFRGLLRFSVTTCCDSTWSKVRLIWRQYDFYCGQDSCGRQDARPLSSTPSPRSHEPWREQLCKAYQLGMVHTLSQMSHQLVKVCSFPLIKHLCLSIACSKTIMQMGVLIAANFMQIRRTWSTSEEIMVAHLE